MAVGDKTAYTNDVMIDSNAKIFVRNFGVEDFETPNAGADTSIAGIWDISNFRKIGISAHENNNAQNQTVYIWVTNQQARPSATRATMIKQCDEITGGEALAKDTTVDILFSANSTVVQEVLNNARWLVIEVIGAAAGGKVDIDITAKS